MWFIIISSFLLLASIFPLANFTHWFFRIFEYGKIQIVTLQIAILLLSFLIIKHESNLIIILQIVTFGFIIFHLFALYKFTPLYSISQNKKCNNSSEEITVISANVYKENKDYDRFKNLIKKYNPSLFLTMESDIN